MTIKELYNWAIANDCADYDIEIYDSDEGAYDAECPEKFVYSPSGYTVIRL